MVDNSDHANNLGLVRSVHAHVDAGVCPCLFASSGVTGQREEQSEQQQQQQQVRLAQHSLVSGEQRDKT